MTFSRKAALRRFLSPVALVAVASLGIVGAHAPALAQKKKEASAPKANYSKGFVEAYKAYEATSKASPADVAALKAALPTVAAAVQTDDDRLATGQAYVGVGNTAKDPALQLQGIDMMIQSNKLTPDKAGNIYFIGGQLAYNAKDYAKARTYFGKAIELGYTENNPQGLLAETYFAQNDNAGGLKVLADAIAARKAAGQAPDRSWVRRGLSVAYSAKMAADAQKWSTMYVTDFPSETSWGDAIAITYNGSNYSAPEMLDLLRLARLTNGLRTRGMYLEYVDAADPRKLPSEVIQVLDAGQKAKLVDPAVQSVKDSRSSATARLAADKAELPALLKDAGSGSAKLVTVMAAADTLLSYGRYAEAEPFYTRAAAMPGANLPLIHTRLGIAQELQGKHAEAEASFAKVQGPRQPIANLWTVYAKQKAAGTVIAPAEPKEAGDAEIGG